jgi:hypothetical protein
MGRACARKSNVLARRWLVVAVLVCLATADEPAAVSRLLVGGCPRALAFRVALCVSRSSSQGRRLAAHELVCAWVRAHHVMEAADLGNHAICAVVVVRHLRAE